MEEKKARLEKQIKEITNFKSSIKIYFILSIFIISSFIFIQLFVIKGKLLQFFDEERSVIMKEDEKSFLFSEIERKTNKKIKKINKLYQETIDGGDIVIFHKKCDSISNTLVLIKSEGNARFGGFTPIPWKSVEGYEDKYDSRNETFVFSLDEKQSYHLISTSKSAVCRYLDFGPCFGSGDIIIKGNPIEEEGLRTYLKSSSFDFKSAQYPLSERSDDTYIKIREYEIFQVIFND